MRKRLFSTSAIRLLLFAAVLFSINKAGYAQCGASSFNEGGTITPTGTWNSVNVGSGTFTNFTVVPNRIYSFQYANTPSIGGYEWDMTLSSSSGLLTYNNSVTPLLDPYTGGQCAPIGRPESTDWWSGGATGIITVNTHSWNGACNNFVSGLNSALLNYKECIPSADQGSGSGVWNVDAYATADLDIPIPAARYGYYTTNTLGFATTYPGNTSVSSTPGWVGCEVPADNATVRARRTGFTCGLYTISDNAHDDNVRIYLNGNLIYSAPCCVAGGVVGDPNGYVLSSSDNLEVRFVDVCGNGNVNIGVNPVTLPALSGGTIGGVADQSSVCEGSVIGNFTNQAGATGGTVGFSGGGVYTYDWELSTDGGGTFNSVGVSTTTWNSTNTVPVGATYVIRRKVTDGCGTVAYSNTITVIGRPLPNGSMSTANSTVCPGTPATIDVTFSPGTAPFNVVYNDQVTNFTANGLNNPDVITVNPVNPTTLYNFTTITDAYGCVRSSGFTSGVSITVIPAITYNSAPVVTDALCNGGGTGTITVNAQGGNGGLEYSIDNGNNYQSSNVFTGLLAGSYDVVVRDNFGCEQPYGTPTIVGQPTDVTQTLDSVDASCANVFDGSITVTASGGTPGYNYSLNGGPLQPSNVFNGIGAGSYLVYVYDANSCLDTARISINNNYIISVAIDSQANVSCVGANDGSFTVRVNGGIPPYTYSINGATYQTSGTFTGLSAGTYIAIGRDSKGCTETVNVTIAPPAPILVSIDSVQNVLCNGTATGAIYITATGGNPGGFTYLWSPGGGATEDTAGLVAGVYNVTVTDSRGCFSTAGATVTQPLPLFLNIASYNDLLCNGDSSGAIDITANGGVPPYSYAWSSGENTEDISDLILGTYTATVTDGNGCTATISQVINEPTPLVVTGVVTNATCYGAANGSIDITVTGGTPSYTYLWSTFQTSEDVTGLSGGTYNVIVTDNNGCQKGTSFVVGEPTQLVLTTAITQISCFNSNDGAIDLTVTGGTPGYTYVWSPGNTPTEDLSGLNGNTYSVTVTDANGCTATTQVTIVNPTMINTSFIVKNPLCYADSNGAVDLIPSGGSYPYTFAWNNGANTEDLTAIPAGTYIVTITDSKNCVKVDSATLVEPKAIYTSGFTKNVSCNGKDDGFIDITAYGGTLPYSFQWSSGSTTEDIGSLSGGSYLVTVSDANGCLGISQYDVIEPAVLRVQAVGTDVSCFGGCNGTVSAIPTGGTTPYEYLWSNFIIDSTQGPLCAGLYIVELVDSNLCHTFDSVRINEPTDITINGVVTDVFCNGFNTGAILVTVGGGTPGYTFLWSNGATTQSVSGLVAGTYSVTVTDSRGCVKTATFVVGEISSIHTTASISNPTCFGSNNAFVSVSVTGGTPPYVYNWNTTPAQGGAVATNLIAGVYELTVTDVNSCSGTVSATVTNPTPIVVTTTPTDSRCSNVATGTVTASVTGGVPPYIYELNGIAQPSNTFTNLAPGNYVIVVTDVNGCDGTKTFTITSPTPLTVDLAAAQIQLLQGMTTQLTATANLPVVSYTWSPLVDSAGNSLFDFSNCGDPANCSNPYVKPYFTTVFAVTVMNADSCYASDTVTIGVQAQPSAFISTAFTPNGDGLNDRFEFDILGVETVDIEIYDRWGHKVYANKSQPNGFTGTNGWDGTVDGKVAPFDTYIWQMKLKYFNGIDFAGLEVERSGTITIMK